MKFLSYKVLHMRTFNKRELSSFCKLYEGSQHLAHLRSSFFNDFLLDDYFLFMIALNIFDMLAAVIAVGTTLAATAAANKNDDQDAESESAGDGTDDLHVHWLGAHNGRSSDNTASDHRSMHHRLSGSRVHNNDLLGTFGESLGSNADGIGLHDAHHGKERNEFEEHTFCVRMKIL